MTGQSLVPQRCMILAVLFLVHIFAMGQTDRDRYIDVGKRKLHVDEAGITGPIVVFESGLGEDISTWKDVQPDVAKFAHTVTYERAGIGKSDALAGARSMPQMVTDLHTMLHNGKFAPPFILVGHSLGGALVQVFAATYPKEIAGLVLVDPEDGRLIDALKTHMSESDWANRQKALDAALPQFSPAQRAELALVTSSGKEMAELPALPQVPIVLLTGTLKNPEVPGNPLEQDLKLELHKQFLAANPQTKQVLVPNSRHYIQNDAPTTLIQAIHEVVAEAFATGGSAGR